AFQFVGAKVIPSLLVNMGMDPTWAMVLGVLVFGMFLFSFAHIIAEWFARAKEIRESATQSGKNISYLASLLAAVKTTSRYDLRDFGIRLGLGLLFSLPFFFDINSVWAFAVASAIHAFHNLLVLLRHR